MRPRIAFAQIQAMSTGPFTAGRAALGPSVVDVAPTGRSSVVALGDDPAGVRNSTAAVPAALAAKPVVEVFPAPT